MTVDYKRCSLWSSPSSIGVPEHRGTGAPASSRLCSVILLPTYIHRWAGNRSSHQSNTVLCPEFVICGNSLLKVCDLVATSVNCMSTLYLYRGVDWKCRTWKWRTKIDQWHENAGPENAGPNCRGSKCRTWKWRTKSQGMKMQDLKMRDHRNRMGKWRTSCRKRLHNVISR